RRSGGWADDAHVSLRLLRVGDLDVRAGGRVGISEELGRLRDVAGDVRVAVPPRGDYGVVASQNLVEGAIRGEVERTPPVRRDFATIPILGVQEARVDLGRGDRFLDGFEGEGLTACNRRIDVHVEPRGLNGGPV